MKYDFIVVGSGPASSVIASRLAHSPSAPQGYQTIPQKHLLNRQINYSAGKGLGGSSCINFAFYTRGPNADWDEWSNIVGDDFFNARNAEKMFKRFEGFELVPTKEHLKYVNPFSEHHSFLGPVKISVPKVWERNMEAVIKVAEDFGLPSNLDINSGNPIGNGVDPATGSMAKRTTAATAYLSKPPNNLTIMTHALATKIIFEGKKTIGTPKLLLLSGIGAKEELSAHGIPHVVDLPGVGKNLQDHPHIPLTVQLTDGKHDRARWADAEVIKASRAKFEKDGSGSLSILYNTVVVGFFRDIDAVYNSKEFADLPIDVQRFIKTPTIPTWEQAVLCPTRGTATLASSNPTDPPLIDPAFFSHPFDRRSFIEAIRISYALLTCPANAKDTTATYMAPKSTSDDDIWTYIQENVVSTFHPGGTAKMGKDGDGMAVVDARFRVMGVEGLRVADLSVVPLLPNCHTVSTGYLIGELAAERLVREYGLDLSE
ncbi:alcohol oxidase [Tothia fuscella]|uniref:Alcohol oxidase n=1 Tax=Tothia fuscella TaxID=1048955 RepID=A0A9P4NEE3_9PEZI|nr:alcohol oxidase [Tothia fuscella]